MDLRRLVSRCASSKHLNNSRIRMNESVSATFGAAFPCTSTGPATDCTTNHAFQPVPAVTLPTLSVHRRCICLATFLVVRVDANHQPMASRTTDNSKLSKRITAPTGSGDRILKSNSPSTPSRDTFKASACTSCEVLAARVDSSLMVNLRCAGKRMEHRMGKGSSRRVVNGGSVVSTMPRRKSAKPLPVQSST
jgi:hypothetical protein